MAPYRVGFLWLISTVALAAPGTAIAGVAMTPLIDISYIPSAVSGGAGSDPAQAVPALGAPAIAILSLFVAAISLRMLRSRTRRSLNMLFAGVLLLGGMTLARPTLVPTALADTFDFLAALENAAGDTVEVVADDVPASDSALVRVQNNTGIEVQLTALEVTRDSCAIVPAGDSLTTCSLTPATVLAVGGNCDVEIACDSPEPEVCEAVEGTFCGGIAGISCSGEGEVCVDTPGDMCDPFSGDIDCGGFCAVGAACVPIID